MIDAIKFRELVEAWACGDEGAKQAVADFTLEHARALLALVEDGWQPIETAPRDGTQILACAQLSDGLIVQGYTPDQSIVKWCDREKDFIAMADGYFSIKSQGDMWTTYHEPYVTHWRPLPPPPETKP